MQVKNSVVPTEEQIAGFLDPGPDGPIYMVNLLKFKDRAEYEDGRATDLTGEEAYGIYADAVTELLEEFGGGAECTSATILTDATIHDARAEQDFPSHGLVAHELAPVERQLCDVLGIEVCYRDPGVAHFGLENALMPIGNQLLEVVAPTREGTAGGRYLERRGAISDDRFQMINKILIAHLVVRLARDINEVIRCRTGQPDICFPRLARAIHDTANHCHVHGCTNVFKTVFQFIHGTDDVEVLARTTRTGNEINAVGTQLETLQDLETHLDLLNRVSRQ